MEATEFKSREPLDSTAATDALTPREKHLIGLAVTATRGCTVCTGGRIEKALADEVPYETVRAAIDLAAAVNAGVTLRTAIDGANAVEAAKACTDGTCA